MKYIILSILLLAGCQTGDKREEPTFIIPDSTPPIYYPSNYLDILDLQPTPLPKD